MNRYLILSLLGLSLLACRKKKEPSPEPPPAPDTEIPVPSIGHQTGPGIHKSDLITVPVGTEDQTIEYIDSRFLITIPAGTFTGPATMTVEEITDSCQGNLGYTYRITANQPLKKPIELAFDYRFMKLHGSDLRCLMVAHHNSNKVWYVQENYEHDAARTRIVIRTKDVGDFALMRTLLISPKDSSLVVGGETDVEVMRVIPLRPQEDNAEVLAPLKPVAKDVFTKGIPVIKAVPLERELVNIWTAEDLAAITDIGNHAICHAKHENPEGKDARIYAHLNSRVTTDFLLAVSYTLPITGDALELKIAHQNWFSVPARITEVNGMLRLLYQQDEYHVMIAWPATGTGTWNWETANAPHAVFEAGNIYMGDRMSSRYNDPVTGEVKPSGGSLTITSNEGPDGFVEGHFVLTNAGRYYDLGYRVSERVEGKFRVKRMP